METALHRAQALWARLAQEDYPNGAVIFCSESLAEAFHPARPLTGCLYRDGKDFDTAVIQEALDLDCGPSYGVVTVDGTEASLGTTQGLGGQRPVNITVLAHLNSTLKGRTRKGGQSAERYGRTREIEELEFLRDVAARAKAQLGHVGHLILGGKADMKRKLLKQLCPELQKRVLCLVDLNCSADRDSLRQAALRAQGFAQDPEQRDATAAVAEFFEKVERGEACYGPEQTLRALELRAVHTLLVASPEDSWSCANADVLRAAEEQGLRCVNVPAVCEDSVRFSRAFKVGGLLRWSLAPELLEDQEASDCESFEAPQVPGTPSTAAEATTESGSEPGSVVHSAKDEVGEALEWLTSQLTPQLGEAEAESLRDVAMVLMGDGLVPVLEVLRAEGVPEEVLEGFELMCCGIHAHSA